MSREPLIHGDKMTWLRTVWAALHEYNDDHPDEDLKWDDLCTAMAWIAEELGIDPSSDEL